VRYAVRKYELAACTDRPTTASPLLDSFKLEDAEAFAPIDWALVALGREGQPVAVPLEEADLIGPEARVVPSNIYVMDDLDARDRVCPGVRNHRLVQLRALSVGWLVASGNYAASCDE
jgi:hypothetical protein